MKQNGIFLAVIFALMSGVVFCGPDRSGETKFVIGYHVHDAGFFSALLGVLNNIAWSETQGTTPVVYWGKGGSDEGRNAPYYQEEVYNGCTNVWEYYFEPVSSASYEPGDPITCNYHISDLILSNKNGWNSIKVGGRDYRKKIKDYLDKYVKVRREVSTKVDAFYDAYIKGRKTIAIHLRGTDKYKEIDPVKTEEICSIANTYAAKSPGCQFLVCTDELSLLRRAQELLEGDVIFYDTYRSENGEPVHLDKKNKFSPAKLGEEVLIEALLMARCDLFVHTCNNVAAGVLFFNPDLDTVLNQAKQEPIPNVIHWPS